MTTRALALLATMAGTTLSITACSVSLSVDDQNQSSIAVENNITTADSRATPEPPSWFAVVDGKEITPPSIPMETAPPLGNRSDTTASMVGQRNVLPSA